MSDDRRPPGDSDATRTSAAVPVTPSAQLPLAIGQYRILGKLGEGGMGVVYEAQQEHPRRTVAVKVVRGGRFIDEHHVRMFQREADTLGRLKHPNIATIYESGRTEDGRHFFAMELVQGDTLGVHLERRPSVSTSAELKHRLGLFRKIVDAVNYAHQRGVIHRDLKPSNVVVIDEAAREGSNGNVSGDHLPEIKILDFGLARITEGDIAAATMTTEVGVIKGTLAYMSPEQARGNPEEIDVRTDVYALGVMLYEMLTGSRPYEVSKKSLAEAVRVICEDSPRSLKQSSSGVRKLDPDIETIVGKALEKEADRRYASAAALSEDVARYLTSQPILARPPSTVYQLRKFARRNMVLVGGVAAVFLALAVGAAVSTWQAVRATRAKAEARQEARAAEQVSQFLVGLFKVSDPSQARGNTITAREILDKGAERIREELADQPLLRARLIDTMGSVYWSLGLNEQARSLFEHALAIRREFRGEKDPDTLRSIANVATMLTIEGRLDEAEALLVEALDNQRRSPGADHPDTLTSMVNLAGLYLHQGRHDEAEPLFLEALEGRRRVLGEDHVDTLICMINLAGSQWLQGRHSEAEALYRETLGIQRRFLGEDHPDTLASLESLGALLGTQGRHDEAEPVLLEALEAYRRVLGERHLRTLHCMGNLVFVLTAEERYDEAKQFLERLITISEDVLGTDHADYPSLIEALGGLLVKTGDLEEGERQLRRAVEMYEARGGDHRLGRVLYELARLSARRDDRENALDFLRRSVEQGHADEIILAGPDLASLRGDPAFEAIVAAAKKRIGER